MHGRLFLAVIAGSGATLAILFAMNALIEFGPAVTVDVRERDQLEFIRVVREPELPPEEPPPTRPPAPPPVPETILPGSESTGGPILVAHAAEKPDAEFGDTLAIAVNDGPLVAVLRVQPTYPNRAITQGIEGYVVVEFTVTPEGTTAGHRVVESSHGMFEPAAIRAAERFRFRPRVIDGVAVATHGIRNRFRFEMDKH